MKDVLAAVGAFVLVVWGLGLLSTVDDGPGACRMPGGIGAVKRAPLRLQVSTSHIEIVR